MIDTEGIVLTKGDRVILTKPKKRYSIGNSNPVLGSEYFRPGVFVSDGDVVWDNGCNNSYGDEELTIYNTQPIMAPTEGKCVSIWEKIVKVNI